MTEIQGKSILVRVSARFELVRVRVIGNRLYNDAALCFNRTKLSRNQSWMNLLFSVLQDSILDSILDSLFSILDSLFEQESRIESVGQVRAVQSRLEQCGVGWSSVEQVRALKGNLGQSRVGRCRLGKLKVVQGTLKIEKSRLVEQCRVDQSIVQQVILEQGKLQQCRDN